MLLTPCVSAGGPGGTGSGARVAHGAAYFLGGKEAIRVPLPNNAKVKGNGNYCVATRRSHAIPPAALPRQQRSRSGRASPRRRGRLQQILFFVYSSDREWKCRTCLTTTTSPPPPLLLTPTSHLQTCPRSPAHRTSPRQRDASHRHRTAPHTVSPHTLCLPAFSTTSHLISPLYGRRSPAYKNKPPIASLQDTKGSKRPPSHPHSW